MGHYMLFLVDTDGVPSIGRMVKVDYVAGGPAQPEQPAEPVTPPPSEPEAPAPEPPSPEPPTPEPPGPVSKPSPIEAENPPVDGAPKATSCASAPLGPQVLALLLLGRRRRQAAGPTAASGPGQPSTGQRPHEPRKRAGGTRSSRRT